jgi:hypothetical protein
MTLDMKKIIFTLLAASLLTSCVAIKFPSEITIHLEVDETLTEDQVDRLIAKIPTTIGKKKIRTRVELGTKHENTDKDN